VHDSSSNYVEYFVVYCENVARANGLLDELAENLEDLNDLSQLIADFKIKVTETHKQKVFEANNNMGQLKKKLEDAASNYDQNLAKSAKKMEKMIPELFDKLKSIQERLENPIIDDKNQVIAVIVKYLDETKLLIHETLEATQKTNLFQKALVFEVSNFEKIHELEQQFLVIQRLWNGRQDFYDFVATVNNVHFLKLDFASMEQFSFKIKRVAAQCGKDLEANEVSKIFRNEVAAFLNHMETLRFSFSSVI